MSDNTPQTDLQNEPEPAAGPKRPRGLPFTGKDDPRNRQNREAAAPLSEDSQGMLEAMRHVVTKPPSKDTTHEQREYRRWLKQDRKGFMGKKADLERAALGSKDPAKGQEPKEPEDRDAGADRGMALCQCLLSEAAREQAREDAELATRPGAAERGRAGQEALRAALWDERLAREEFVLSRGEVGGQLEGFIVGLSDEYYDHRRAQDLELAVRPDPENAIGSLEHALKATREREEMWKHEAGQLNTNPHQEAGNGRRS